jgi:hypothetical protein
MSYVRDCLQCGKTYVPANGPCPTCGPAIGNIPSDDATSLLDQFCRMDEFFASDAPAPVGQCEPGDHVFEMHGPPPWPCTFCGHTPKLEG